MLIPLAQISDASPVWLVAVFVGLPSVPLAGFLAGLMFRRNLSALRMAICIAYYLLVGLTIAAISVWAYAWIFLAGLFLNGPILGLVLLIFAFSPQTGTFESQRFPVVPKARNSNPC